MMKTTVPANIADVTRAFYRTLDHDYRRRCFWLFLLMVLRAIFETFSVGLIAFYAAAISDPHSVLKTPYVVRLREMTGWPPGEAAKDFILWLSIAVIVFVVLKNALGGRMVYAVSRLSADIEQYVGNRLLRGFLSRDYQWYLERNSSDILQVLQWRVYLGRHFMSAALKLVSEVVVLISLITALLLVQPRVSALFFCVQGGISYFFYKKLRRNLDLKSEACKEKELAISREVTRAVHGFKDVRITATGGRFVHAFDSLAKPFARDYSWQQFWKDAPLLTLESAGFVLICGTILFMLYGLHYSPLEITGTTALLAVTAWRSLPSVNRILSSLTSIRTALPYVCSLLPEIEMPKDTGLPEQPVRQNCLSFEREIRFENVSFHYRSRPEKEVLSGIDLVIPKGQAVGLMGTSGYGKSTLVDLLVGLLEPTSGRIVVDGREMCPENVASWIENVGYVAQSPYIFDGTLAENVAFGIANDAIDRDRVLECCRLAAVDFIPELAAGIDTFIGERGVRLSGGQRQRVAIARALYRDPPLIIFDEATSALDEENDRRIRSLVGALRGGRTLVVIAHRPSTLEMCDRIYRFNEDRVLVLQQ